MASHGRDTDDDEVDRPKELTVMGRKTRSSVYTLYVRDSNKEKRSQKPSIDLGCTFLLDSEDFEGYKHGPRTNTRWMTSCRNFRIILLTPYLTCECKVLTTHCF
jgi:hypothetical protein